MNPKTTIDAVLTVEEKNEKYQIYPLTIGRQALLELVKSPFVFPTDNVTLTSLLPSFYIMLMNKDELKKYLVTIKDAITKMKNVSDNYDKENTKKSDLITSEVLENEKELEKERIKKYKNC